MDVTIISSDDGVQSLFDDWRSLQLRTGQFLFTDPAFFRAWWDIQGRQSGRKLHVVTGRSQGRLVALAPLVVVRRYGLHILEWAGANIFDYSDTLLDCDADSHVLWGAIRKSRAYDVAFLRGIHNGSNCYSTIAQFGQPARRSIVHQVYINWPSGDAWLSEMSSARRKRLRRTERQLESCGDLSFSVHRNGQAPAFVMKALIEQKTAWAVQHGRPGLFDDASSAATLLTHFADVAETLGSLHLSWLSLDEQVIAAHLGFVYRGMLYYYMPTYDMAWSQYSPGNFLLAKLIAWCSDNKLLGVDFMRGDHAYKATFASSHISLEDFSFARSAKGWVAEAAARTFYFREGPGAGTTPSPN